jgi:hypothetical protein
MFAPAETLREEIFALAIFPEATLITATFAPATFKVVMFADVTLRDRAFMELIHDDPKAWVD